MATLQSATLRQGMQLLKLAIDKALPLDELQRRIDSGVLSDVLDSMVDWNKVDRDMVRVALGLAKLNPDPVITELPGVVLPDPSVTFGDRITAGGYDWKNGDITEKRFPLTLPAGPRQLVTAWFQKDVSKKYVEDWAEANGYRVTVIDDLFAVGSHSEYRKLQLEYPIVALGSSAGVDGHWRVPYLYGSGAGRSLDLYWCVFGFLELCRFLLVRK